MRVSLLLPWIAKLYQRNLPLYSLMRNVPGVYYVGARLPNSRRAGAGGQLARRD